MFLSFCVGGIILVWVANFVSDFDAGTSIVIVIIAIILVISGLHGYIVSESNNSNSGKSSEQLIQETQDEDQKENHEKDNKKAKRKPAKFRRRNYASWLLPGIRIFSLMENLSAMISIWMASV